MLLLVATAAVIAILGKANPVVALDGWMSGGGEAMRLQPSHLDARTFDVKHGDDFLATITSRSNAPDAQRLVLFVGNSQQYTSSLAKGASTDPSHEAKLTSDLFAEKLEARAPGAYAVYNVAAPNQNFVEALWQGIYWFRVSKQRPTVLVIQSSFDTYRKLGIRPGYQTLLSDPAFVTAVEEHLAQGPRAYLDEFAVARRNRAERERELAKGSAEGPSTETMLRRALEHVPLYRRRSELRASFLNILYLARVRALNISPTSRRHITGQPLAANFEALTDLVRLARAAGAKVLIYNAPTNPAVDMFYPDEYADLLSRLAKLAGEEGASFVDLGSAVPQDEWGYWIDGPDPIHVDERGHRTIAARLDDAFGPLLGAAVH